MREELAELMHEIWAGWTDHIFTQTVTWEGKTKLIPVWAVERWTRQIGMLYSELSEEEKDSDRKVADKVLELFAKHLLIVNTVIERNSVQSMPERIAEARHAMVCYGNVLNLPVPTEVVMKWLAYIEDGEWSAEEGEGDE